MKCVWSVELLVVGVVALLLGSCRTYSVPEMSGEELRLAKMSESQALEIGDEFTKYLRTGLASARLEELGDELRTAHSQKDIFTQSLVDLSAADQYFACTMCRAAVKVVSQTFTAPNGELTGPNRDENARNALLSMCDYFDIQTPAVCGGLFDLNWPILDFILNETIAESRSICGMLPIQICQLAQEEYMLNLSIEGESPVGSNSELAERSDEDLVVLHLTDIHYDPDYRQGSWAECSEPICCRDDQPAGSQAVGAGYWSDYRTCDTPRHLIVNTFDHIRQTHKPDWIYHTGDVPPHNVWSTTKQGNMDMLTEIDGLLEEYFPGIPIYPCLGNHEPHPTNVFGNNEVPADLSIDWLYSHLWSLWSKWLPEDAKATILRGGYYTVSPSPGHRIVALNSMDCYMLNWWIYYNGSIVLEQLQWFHDTLLAAEKAGERVHVLTHIPSGDSDCWADWSREYNRLLTRFSHCITGIFNGHTHKDEMSLHYSDAGDAVAVSWNGGSLTTYTDKNPNYRLYQLSPQSWQVLDHETWTFNLTEANLRPEESPKWYKEYTFAQEFTNDTSPAGIDSLLEKMANQPDLLRKFWRFKVTNADPKLTDGCDDSCLSSTLCRIATSNYRNKQRCQELQAILRESLDKEDNGGGDGGGGGGAAALLAQSLPALFTLLCVLRYL